MVAGDCATVSVAVGATLEVPGVIVVDVSVAAELVLPYVIPSTAEREESGGGAKTTAQIPRRLRGSE